MEYYKWIMLASILGGLVAAGMTLRLATHGQTKTWRLVRCFAGFICSMVWIAAIADEVVSVLQASLVYSAVLDSRQAVGEILGLSDAIIGLTSKCPPGARSFTLTDISLCCGQQSRRSRGKCHCSSVRSSDGVRSMLRGLSNASRELH